MLPTTSVIRCLHLFVKKCLTLIFSCSQSIVNHAQRSCTPRYQGPQHRQGQRGPPQSLPICCAERDPFPASATPSSAAAEHIWKVHSSDDGEEPLLRIWAWAGYHQRVRTLSSTWRDWFVRETRPHFTTSTVPVPTEGAQPGTPWRAQSFLVDGGHSCIGFHGCVSFSFLLVKVYDTDSTRRSIQHHAWLLYSTM